MKILLVNPKMAVSLYTFQEAQDITGRPGYIPNLALPTLAAMVPPDAEVTLVDEEVEPIAPFLDQPWDIVGITGYIIQKRRMFELAAAFRSRGRLVAIGGPYATLSSGTVRDHADVLFTGEAEETWPRFLADFRSGRHEREYAERSAVDLDASPVPDVERLRRDAYLVGAIQTSRGCPFTCEFCDVIVYLGRNQRHKRPERIVEEVERLHAAGYRAIFLSDDNFTANRKRAREIMRAVGEWNRRQAEPIAFSTQMSVDVARDPELLELCASAGLRQAFVGIETPDPVALREVRKGQNIRPDLAADIHTLQSRGIVVQAGMITGFDADTPACFDTQFEFLQRAGVPMVLVAMLNAPEGTPLERRLAAANRLKPSGVENGCFETNIIPKNMTTEELYAGTRRLLNRLYSPGPFLERIARLAENLPPAGGTFGANPRSVMVWHRLLRWFEAMGPEMARIPRAATELFRSKDTQALATVLIFYKHVVCVLIKEGLWAPEAARSPAAVPAG